MKLKEFMHDSLGVRKGSVKIPVEGMIATYRKKYEKLKEKGLSCTHEVYAVTPGGRTMVHVKIPSETVSNFNYDVLLEFSGESTVTKFDDCDIKVFSNSPSFVYTYAYVFYHLDPNPTYNTKTKSRTGMMIDMFRHKIPRDRLLMPGTEKKLGEDVVDNAPVIRNPFGLPLFDKSIYFALFYIQENLDYATATRTRKYRTAGQIIANVSDFDALMAKRKQTQMKQREKAKRQRSTENAVFTKKESGIRKANTTGTGVKTAQTMTRAKSTIRAKSASSNGAVKRIGGK